MTSSGAVDSARSSTACAQSNDSHAQGWLTAARRVESPNFDARPADVSVSLLVLHHISLPEGQFSGDAVERLFTNQLSETEPVLGALASLRVSAHFFIRRDGKLIQFVNVFDRAWHAGVSCWRGRERCNDFSVGIEIEGDCNSAFAAAQYQSLNQLIVDLQTHLPIKHITTHSEIALGRKVDPGPKFDLAIVKYGLEF